MAREQNKELGLTETQKRLKAGIVSDVSKAAVEYAAIGDRGKIRRKAKALKPSSAKKSTVLRVSPDNDEGNGHHQEGEAAAEPVTTAHSRSARDRAAQDGTGESVADQLKRRPDYSEEVQLRLTNLIYDPLATMLFDKAGIQPDEAHLLSLTRINSSREAASWAQQITREAMYNIYVNSHDCDWPPSQIWRVAFLLARRSIPGATGPGFMLGIGLAQEQAITKQEEVAEESDW